MKQILQYFLFLWIWASTIVVIVPGEFVHALAGHQDTRDEAHEDGRQAFETIHVHCFVLKAQLPEFLMGKNLTETISTPEVGCFVCLYENPLVYPHQLTHGLRAPPLV